MHKHEAELTDRVFHALADANRRAVIERLTRGPATVSELVALLGVTLAATVQHLRVLQDSELVRSEKAGRVRTCQIEPAGLRSAEAWLMNQRTAWERRLDRLGAARLAQAGYRRLAGRPRSSGGPAMTTAEREIHELLETRTPAFGRRDAATAAAGYADDLVLNVVTAGLRTLAGRPATS